jgi:hypothetical protein
MAAAPTGGGLRCDSRRRDRTAVAGSASAGAAMLRRRSCEQRSAACLPPPPALLQLVPRRTQPRLSAGCRQRPLQLLVNVRRQDRPFAGLQSAWLASFVAATAAAARLQRQRRVPAGCSSERLAGCTPRPPLRGQRPPPPPPPHPFVAAGPGPLTATPQRQATRPHLAHGALAAAAAHAHAVDGVPLLGLEAHTAGLVGPRRARQPHNTGQLPELPAPHAQQEAEHIALLPAPQLLDVLRGQTQGSSM